MRTDHARDEVAALEQELERARRVAEENQAALGALEEERREREGRVSLALRAQEDLSRRLQEKRDELANAEAEEALQSFTEVAAHRDAVAEAFASAAGSAVTRLQQFDAAQAHVARAWEELAANLTPAGAAALREKVAGDVNGEPPVFVESLNTLVAALNHRSNRGLERDLVEAAARSPMGKDIKDLPEHLRDVARARRKAILEERRRS